MMAPLNHRACAWLRVLTEGEANLAEFKRVASDRNHESRFRVRFSSGITPALREFEPRPRRQPDVVGPKTPTFQSLF